MLRDLLGEWEAIAKAAGRHRPGDIANPPAGMPPFADERTGEPVWPGGLERVPEASRAAVVQFALRLFAASPAPLSVAGAAANPMLFLQLRALMQRHRQAYADHLVRALWELKVER